MLKVESHTVCPFCGARHELAQCVGKSKTPNDGDLSLCMQCGEWCIFEKKAPGHIRRPTDVEYEQIAESPLAKAARTAWVRIDQKRRQKGKKAVS
ncbi:hypothetical protein GOC49_13025 [Sinorhizobium meliloti]|nr:hypothetical protein [Sinorhizobium meliloti]